MPVLVALAAGVAGPGTARGQTYTWNQTASGQDWMTGGNWTPTTAPNAADAVAVFGNVATGPLPVLLSGGVTVGELRFFDVNTLSATTAYTIGTAAQTITLNNGGSENLITVAGITTTTQSVATNFNVASSQPLTINNNGAPGVLTLLLSGNLSAATAGTVLNVNGVSNTTISGAIGGGFGTLTKTGTGTLVLSNASNAYTGGTVINGGTVSVAADTNLGAAGGSITLNGGALQLTTNTFTSGRNITLGAGGGTVLVPVAPSTNFPTLTGVISGSGSLTFDGGQYVMLQGSNTYTGPTVINNAAVLLNSVLLGGTGRLNNTSSITINGYVGGQVGILDIQNAGGGDNNRVNDAAPITLNGGILSFTGPAAGLTTETVGNLTVRGFGSLFGNVVPLSQSGVGTGVLSVGTVTRTDNFTSLYAGGAIAGPSSPGTSVQVTLTGFSTSAGSGQTIAVVPWIGGDNGSGGSATAHADTLFVYDANGLRALDPTAATNFVQISAGGTLNGLVPGAKNNSITGDPAAVNASLTILSLVQNPTSTTSSTISGTGTLTVNSGAIANVNQLAINGPTLNFNANTAYFWLGNEAVVEGTSRITGTGGVVVSSDSEDGRNTLYLLNTSNPNAFTGGLYLNGTGRVAFDTNDAQLGAAGEVISFRGGALRYIGSTSISLATGGVNRPLQLTAAGGGVINVETSGVVLTVPGLVSGTEQLTKLGPGTLVLANTANTYAGGTTLNEGILALGGAGSLGTGPLAIGVSGVTGTTLQFNFSGTYGAAINHAASANFNTNGNTVTLSGVVSGTGATLTKTGTGTLILAGANTYAGNTVVSAGTLLVANSAGSGTGFGSVTVSNGASFGGTGAVGGPVSIASGGTLVVGTGTAPGTLTHHGATTLTSGATFSGVLAGNTAGSGYSQLVVQSGGSFALGSATLNLTLNYTPAPTDKLFIVNNLNATGGLTGQFNTLANGATVTFANGTKAVINYTGDVATGSLTGGNDVVLSGFVPVPEPVGIGAVTTAAAALVWLRRRRK
jgi:autotransporter-associated beta strand protein